MKFALMLYGQPRFITKAYEFGWKKIIDTYNPDVYIHTWFDNSWINKSLPHYTLEKSVSDNITYETLNNIVNLYKPKCFIYEPPPDFDKIMHRYTNTDQRIEQAMYGQHISAFKINKSRLETGISYDLVMRSRIDMIIDLQDITKLPRDEINVPYIFDSDMMSPIMDQYAIGSSENMTKYCEVAKNIDRYVEMGATVQSEFLIHLNLVEKNVKINRIEYKGIIAREYDESMGVDASKKIQHIDHFDISGKTRKKMENLQKEVQ